MNGMLSRKQLWRKCYVRNRQKELNLEIPHKSILKNNNKKNNIIKNVTFNQIKYVTLIPNNDEMNDLFTYYFY